MARRLPPAAAPARSMARTSPASFPAMPAARPACGSPTTSSRGWWRAPISWSIAIPAGCGSPSCRSPASMARHPASHPRSRPHLWRLPGRAGVLSFEAMRRGIPAAGCEIGGRGGLLAADSDRYLQGLRRVLAHRGLIDAADLPPAPSYRSCLDGDWALAPVAGFIDNHVELGERVAAGARLATIASPLGTVLASLTAARDGLVMGVRRLRRPLPRRRRRRRRRRPGAAR